MLNIKPANLTKRLFHLNKYISNQKYSLSTNQVDNNKVFLTDQYSNFTFGDLNNLSSKLSTKLLKNLNTNDLKGEKIAVLCSNNYTYLVSLLAIWKANGVPLGLNKQYPINLLEYFINDSKCKLAINGIAPEEAKNTNESLDLLLSNQHVSNFKLVENEFFLNKINKSDQNGENALDSMKRLLDLPENLEKQGLILYTSGTSGPPKGVILSRKNLNSTVETLKQVWEWTPKDKMLHVLPLNHVHGLSYGLLTSFYSGAECEMLAKFNADLVWSKLLDESNNVNVFMAVPTIFVQLVNSYLNDEKLQQKYPKDYIKHIFKNKIRYFTY